LELKTSETLSSDYKLIGNTDDKSAHLYTHPKQLRWDPKISLRLRKQPQIQSSKELVHEKSNQKKRLTQINKVYITIDKKKQYTTMMDSGMIGRKTTDAVTLKDVPVGDFIAAYADHLKKSNKLALPKV
jgi:hypothetical protein